MTRARHLLALDHLRHGIGLRAYGQRDPLNENKREAFEMFEGMLSRLREQITIVLAHIEARLGPAPEQAAPPPPQVTIAKPKGSRPESIEVYVVATGRRARVV